MNIIIANGQEINPQLGGIEKDSTILAEEFVSLGHNVYFIAGKMSPYSNAYKPVVDQTFLPDQNHYLCNENIRFFSEYLLHRKADVIMNQAGDILEFSLLCSEAVKNSNTKLYSVIHFDPLGHITEQNDFSNSILKVNSLFNRIIKLIFYPVRYYILKKQLRSRYRKIYSNSTKVVLLSKFYIRPFLRLIGSAPGNKITAILNPSPVMHKSLNVKRKKQILYVGRVKYWQKRTDRIIEIWEKIFRDFPDWELVIVGDGPLLNDLKEYVAVNNIERVSFKGLCNPEVYYQESEILCITSTTEGLAMVLVETVQLDCIPVAFDSFPAIHEIIRDNVNGVLIKKFDLKSYIKELRKLMLSPALRNELRNGPPFIDGKFDPVIVTKQWIKLFE